jgi:GxxExxY protein
VLCAGSGFFEQQLQSATALVMEALGPGQNELVYERALSIELRDCGFRVLERVDQVISYKGYPVGHVMMDLVVEIRALPTPVYAVLELKAVDSIPAKDRHQLRKYLASDDCYVEGYLINFAVKAACVQIEKYN